MMMEEITKRLQALVESGRNYARQGLLYEAFYRYGQAVAVIQTMYTLHSSGILALSEAYQAYLAQMRQKLVILSDVFQHSTESGAKADERARESLHNVLQMLREDLAY